MSLENLFSFTGGRYHCIRNVTVYHCKAIMEERKGNFDQMECQASDSNNIPSFSQSFWYDITWTEPASRSILYIRDNTPLWPSPPLSNRISKGSFCRDLAEETGGEGKKCCSCKYLYQWMVHPSFYLIACFSKILLPLNKSSTLIPNPQRVSQISVLKTG